MEICGMSSEDMAEGPMDDPQFEYAPDWVRDGGDGRLVEIGPRPTRQVEPSRP